MFSLNMLIDLIIIDKLLLDNSSSKDKDIS